MKIAYINDALIVCGGVITNFEHCQELRKRGYDAFICANGRNEDLHRSYPDVPIRDIQFLDFMKDEDIIVANWWPMCEWLVNHKGRKIQFVQGNDLKSYTGQDWRDKCLKARRDECWDLMAVSQYAGEWTGREFTIIPNGINDRFFEDYGMEKDIDALIEGNDEPNKNIPYSINEAKKDGHKKIVWLGRQTHPIDGVECITNPPQEEIPKIYQRARNFYKHSLSEGFCLPILEALASGCEIHTWDQGNNFDLDNININDYRWSKIGDKLVEFYENTNTKSRD